MSRYAAFVPPEDASAGPPAESPAVQADLVVQDGFAIVLASRGSAWIYRADGSREDISSDGYNLALELFGAPEDSYDSVN
jgi:hypothetical protein